MCDIITWIRIASKKYEVKLDGGADVSALKSVVCQMPQFSAVPANYIRVRVSEESNPLDPTQLLDEYNGRAGTEAVPFVVDGPSLQGIT
jgi:hypothetical protein